MARRRPSQTAPLARPSEGMPNKFAAIRRWTEAKGIRQNAGGEVLRRHLEDLLAYLDAN